MRGRALRLLAIAGLGTACAAGPTPRQAPDPNVPIHNTAAVVSNIRAVTDIDDSSAALAVLAQLDRDPRDRPLDARYQGADVLTFLGVRPGMRVLDLTAGGGYVTELLARSVGESGEVFANEPPSLAGSRVKEALRSRFQRFPSVAVVPSERELASPVPERAHDLDLVYLSLPYRTAESRGVNVAAMNRAAFDALAAGGTYVVLDYRPRVRGPTPVDLHALHEAESANTRHQVEPVGFGFVTEGRFLRNDSSPDEWDAILAARPTALEEQDRFLLKFVKP
jgi:predicted methyltransferase